MQLSKGSVCKKKNPERIENSLIGDTVRHHSASLEMPNSYHEWQNYMKKW